MVPDYMTARVRVKAPAVLLGLFAVLVIAASLSAPAQAATSSNLNFQARILGTSGTIVPDGNYNIDFKLYNADSTTGSVGTCSGACLWEETRTNAGGHGVQVINGYFSVNLGSVTAFPAINWDQPLWLTMNIGGTSSGAVTWDGEMQNSGHSIALTALPYSFTAGQLSKTSGANRGTLSFNTVANNPAILLPDASGTVCLQAASACGFESTTGTDFIQNQNSVVQTANFNINGTGVLGTSLITGLIQTTDSSTANTSGITLRSGNQTGSSLTTGAVTIKSGDASGGTNSSSGNVSIDVGAKSGTGTTGTIGIGTSNASGLTLGNITTTNTASLDASTINVGTTTQTHTINLATGGTSTQIVNIGSTSSSSAVAVNAGSGGVSVNSNTTFNGTDTIVSNSATAFQVQNSSNVNVFKVDNSGNNITLSPSNNGQVSLVSDLTGGARSTYALSISQANNATNNNSTGLLQLSNADAGSTAALLNVNQIAAGTGISVSGITTGTAIDVSSITSGIGINLGALSATGNGIQATNVTTGIVLHLSQNNTTNSSAGALLVDGSASGALTNQAGAYIAVEPNKTLTSGNTTENNDYLDLIRNNTVNHAGSTYTVNGDLAYLASNCTQSAGTCTDTGHLLELNQQYANASGAVLQVQGSGTGNLLQLQTGTPTQVFTVSNTGTVLSKNSANSATAFQVQNASGTSIFNVDTTSGVVGTASVSAGSTNSNGLTIRTGNATGSTSNSGSLTIDTGTATGTAGNISIGTGAYAHSITLGNSTGASGVTINAGSGGISLGANTTVSGTNSFTVSGGNSLLGANLDVTGSVAFKNSATNFSTTGISNDVSFGNVSLVRLTGASAQTITGITNGRDGYVLTIQNAAGQAATIANQNTSSTTAADRILTGSGGDLSLPPDGSVILVYDATTQRWRVTGLNNGVTTIGTYSSSNHYANGAQVSGNSLILGSADSSNPGLIDTSSQSFAGNKTFSGTLTVAPTTNIGSVVIKQTSAASPSNDIFDVQGTNGTSNFIQITSTAANQGAVNIQSFGSNNITLQAGSGTVSLGTTTTLNAGGALTIASGGTSDLTLDSLSSTLKFGTNTSNLLFTNAGTALVDAASTATLALGTANNAHQTTLGSTNASATTTVQAGNGITLNGSTTVSSGKSFTLTDGAASLTDSTGVPLSVNNGSGANSIAIFQDNGTPVVTVADNGQITFKNAGDTTNAFQIQNNGASDLLNVNTTDGYVIDNGVANLGNVVQNPGFESSGSGDGTGWFTPAAGQAITNDAANAHGGNYELKITGNSLTHAVTTKYYAVNPGDQIYLEAYVKNSAGATGDAGIYIEYSDKDKGNATFTTMDIGLPGTSYVLKSNSLTIPAGKYYVRLAASVKATATAGSFYFDDFYLKKINESAPLLLSGVSTTAFQVQNASGQTVFGVDSSGSKLFSTIPDSGTAVGFTLNTLSYSTSGAKLFSLQNNSSEKFSVDKDGNLSASGNATLGGNISIGSGKQFQINGTQVTSAILSNNSDLAKLSGTGPQQFSGNNEFDGTVLNKVASATAFQVQNASNAVFTVDTSGNRVILGTASNITGSIQFQGSGGAGKLFLVGPTTPDTGNFTLTIPTITANANICTDNSICSGYASSASLTSGLNGKLNKGAVDTSAAAVTAVQGNLYAFTNSSSGIASGVLKLDNGSNTANALTVTGSTDYSTGSAYILVNNTNGTPTGNLIDLQANAADEFTVDAAGNVSAAGNISIASGKQYQINGTQISTSALSDGNTLAKLAANQTFSGNNTFSSASNSFTGDGSGLTNLNATNVATGTLNDGRLSSNVALLNRTGQSFSGDNTFAPTSNNAGTTIKQTSGTATSGSVLDVQTANGTSHFLQVTNAAANEGNVTLQSVGATRDLTLGSGSGNLIITAATNTITHSNSGLTIDINNGTDSTLTITNGQGGAVASLSVEGDVGVASGRVFKVGATSGAGITCSSNTFLQNATTLGGITTGGSCANAVTSISASGGSIANGASIAGNALTLGYADTSNPGLVSNTTQSFNGAKTFTNDLLAKSSSSTAFQVQNSSNRSIFAVDTSGSLVSIGNSTDGAQITLAATGNVSSVIRKSMIVNGTIAANDLVQIDTANAGQVKQAVASSTNLFGVATSATGSGAAQDIVISGIYQINANASGGTIAVGDTLVSSSTAGQATKSGSTTSSGSVIGLAMSTLSGGKVWVYINLGLGGSDNLQTVYNKDVGGTTPDIKVSSGLGGLDIQDADTTISGSLFAVRGSNGSGLGNVILDVQSTSAVTIGTAGSAGTLTNNGSTKNTTLALGDLATGSIGSAASTVDIYTSFSVSPTGAGRSYTIPSPTDGAAGRLIYISNINGSNTFSIGSTVFNTHSTGTLVYDGTSWNFAGMDGGSNNYIQNQSSSDQSASFRIAGTGSITVNNANAFKVQNASSRSLLNVDTNGSLVSVGNSTDGAQITLNATGNASGTVRKSMIVTGSVNANDLVEIDTTNAGQVQQASASSTKVFGVATSSVGSGAAQDIVISGVYQVNANTSGGTPAVGDMLVSSSTVGQVTKAGTTTSSGSVVGLAMSTISSGKIWVYINLGLGGSDNLQTVYNKDASGTTPDIKISSTVGGLDLQDADSALNSSIFTVRNSNSSGLGSAILDVQSFNPLTDVTNNATNNLVTNGSFETGVTGWAAKGSASTPVQSTTYKYIGSASGKIVTTAASNDGASYNLTLSDSTAYTLTFSLRLDPSSNSFATLAAGYNNGSSDSNCSLNSTTVVSSGWTTYSCTFTSASSHSGTPSIYIKQTDTTIHTFYADAIQLSRYSILSNASAEVAFAASDWQKKTGSETSVTQVSTQAQDASNSVQVVTTGSAQGTKHNETLNDSTAYNLTFYAKASGSNFSTLEAGYNDGSANTVCTTAQTVVTTGWTAYSCIFTTTSSHSGTPYFYVDQTDATGRTFFLDNFQLTIGTPAGAYREGAIALNGIITSPVSLQAQSNSTTAFQVQNSSGNNVLAVDSVNKYLKIYENSGNTNYALVYYDTATSTANYTASSGTVAVGTGSGAITVTSGSGAAVNITGNAASTWKTNSGTLTLQSGTGGSDFLILNGGGSGQIQVNGSAVVKLGSSAGDPGTCTVGAVVYNSTSNLFRGCQGSSPAWATLSSTTQTLQQAYTASTGSTTPEVKVDSTRGALDIQDADSTISGNLLAVHATNAGGLGTTLFSVASGGTTTLQSSGGVTLLTANATSTLIQVGNSTAHSTNPVILVLDNYQPVTSGSEPTEADGAMYYDANDGMFRCGRGSAWVNCSVNAIAHSFDFEDDFLAGTIAASSSTHVEGVGSLGWQVSASTNCSVAYTLAGGVTASHDHPGVMRLVTGANSGNGCAMGTGATTAGALSFTNILSAGDDMNTAIAATASTGTYRVGFTNFSASTLPNPTAGVWWEYNNAQDATHWRYCYASNAVSAATCASTTMTFSTASWYHVEIRIVSSTAVTFNITNSAGTLETHPLTAITYDNGNNNSNTNTLSPVYLCYASTTTAQNCYVDYFQWTGTTTTAR